MLKEINERVYQPSTVTVWEIGAMLGDLVDLTWVTEMDERGEEVELFRQYYDGAHRLKLTTEMKSMMQIDDDRLDRYNANYCEMVVDALADRLTLAGIEAAGGGDAAQEWGDALWRSNRLDGLQIKVRESVLIDGETFVMAQVRVNGDGSRTVTLAHEPAWDGRTGILPIYDERRESLVAAVKVWTVTDGLRMNIYYPDQTHKYRRVGTGALERTDVQQTREVGVPLVAFRNRSNGRSELRNVVPLQDSLNRTLVSMVMSAELTAFSVLFSTGWKPPQAITPGMIFSAMVADEKGEPIITDDPEEARAYATLNSSYSLERIEAGSLEQLISQADWLVDTIATVSSTPVPSQMGGSSASGEALKERNSRLTSKAHRAQTQLGNAWEDLWELAQRQQATFGVEQPPAVERWNARWRTAEVRDDNNIREVAKLLHEWGFVREALRVLGQSSVVDYDDKQIDKLMGEQLRDNEVRLTTQAGALDGFELFQAPV